MQKPFEVLPKSSFANLCAQGFLRSCAQKVEKPLYIAPKFDCGGKVYFKPLEYLNMVIHEKGFWSDCFQSVTLDFKRQISIFVVSAGSKKMFGALCSLVFKWKYSISRKAERGDFFFLICRCLFDLVKIFVDAKKLFWATVNVFIWAVSIPAWGCRLLHLSVVACRLLHGVVSYCVWVLFSELGCWLLHVAVDFCVTCRLFHWGREFFLHWCWHTHKVKAYDNDENPIYMITQT